MDAKKLRTAIAEAKRFLTKANCALDMIEGGDYYGELHAATKRSSMDLTRALADLRRRR